jgi:hypothetical protein
LSAPKGSSSADSAATIASATAKTRSVIEGLQARLSGETPHRAQVTSVSPSRKKKALEEEETEEELERQLQTYFASTIIQTRNASSVANLSRTQIHDELRSRVVEGVVHRILAEWARREQDLPGSSRLGNEIMERLIQRVLEQFQELAVAS